MVIFMGKEDWLQKIIGIVYDATRQSLKALRESSST
jgi:hypothetical protein